ncbi:SPFH domain-containing protein [Mycoplasma sp. NEAQ87857]|uniref:SPFH domain-containing protein n=1 Tax=Mycoplasma sp. NEAQ87857 TaxID=2683967 RepID=UPI00131636CE|nr:SPFH domain-containing protein [Mycoplasma sp. NEAQ87857]QGZ97902.1 SPFH domain-containing protein [Mycoplasma sp. NEAQ87857]
MELYSVIEYSGGTDPDWLVWKHPNSMVNRKSKLIVRPGQVCVVIKSCQLLKVVEPGTSNIDSEWLPIGKKGFTRLFGGSNAYPLEFYFVNKRLKLDLKWGTATDIKVIDPKFKISFGLKARGQMGVSISRYDYLIDRLIGSFDEDGIVKFSFISQQIRGWVNQNIKRVISTAIQVKKLSYFDILPRINEINEDFLAAIKEFTDRLGIEIVTSSIESIDASDKDIERLNLFVDKGAALDYYGENYEKVRGYDVYENMSKNQGTVGAIFGMNTASSVTAGANLIPNKKSKKETKILIKCPECNNNVEQNAKFCNECGTKMINSCKSCKEVLQPKAKFCVNCGEKA